MNQMSQKNGAIYYILLQSQCGMWAMLPYPDTIPMWYKDQVTGNVVLTEDVSVRIQVPSMKYLYQTMIIIAVSNTETADTQCLGTSDH